MANVESAGEARLEYDADRARRDDERQLAEATSDMTVVRARGLFSWQSVLAGSAGALAVHLLLMMLGMAFGFGVTDPIQDENPIAMFTGGTALAWTISALIALWVGSWLAGRSAAQVDAGAGAMHGFMVWSMSTIVIFLAVSTGIGLVIGGAASVVGKGLTLASAPITAAATAAGGAAGEMLQDNTEQVKSYVAEVIPASGTSTTTPESIRATREIGRAVTQFFLADDLNANDARAPVVRALVEYGGKSEQDAQRIVGEWATSYQRVRDDLAAAKAKAEQKTREVADEAAHALSVATMWGFVAFLLGIGSAICGGVMGAKCARCKLVPVVVSA